MRYVHLLSKLRASGHDTGARPGPVEFGISTQIANDLRDHLSADDGIVVAATVYSPSRYDSVSPDDDEDKTPPFRCYESGPTSTPRATTTPRTTPPSRTRWVSSHQCVPVSQSTTVRPGQSAQLVIRAELPSTTRSAPKTIRGSIMNNNNNNSGAATVDLGPDIISFDESSQSIVFPPIISVRTAVVEPKPLAGSTGTPAGATGSASKQSNRGGRGAPNLLDRSTDAGLGLRVVRLPGRQVVEIWEDVLTDGYWASVWDAGLAMSAYFSLADSPYRDTIISPIRHVLNLGLPSETEAETETDRTGKPSRQLTAIELGCGCGVLGISLYLTAPNSDVLLTDVSDATSLVERNIRQARAGLAARQRAAAAAAKVNSASKTDDDGDDDDGDRESDEDEVDDGQDTATDIPGKLAFATLDWTKPIPPSILSRRHDLIFLSDCTYNTAFIPALVRTARALALASQSHRESQPESSLPESQLPESQLPSPLIVVGRKIRHTSEHVFEDEMAAAGFVAGPTDTMKLPGNGTPPAWMPTRTDGDDGDDDDDDDAPGQFGPSETIEVMTYSLSR